MRISHRSTRRKSERAMRKHRSFRLPESEQASRQARQEPDGTTVGREMAVFLALAQMVESGWNGNALRTCEPGRRKGLE